MVDIFSFKPTGRRGLYSNDLRVAMTDVNMVQRISDHFKLGTYEHTRTIDGDPCAIQLVSESILVDGIVIEGRHHWSDGIFPDIALYPSTDQHYHSTHRKTRGCELSRQGKLKFRGREMSGVRDFNYPPSCVSDWLSIIQEDGTVILEREVRTMMGGSITRDKTTVRLDSLPYSIAFCHTRSMITHDIIACVSTDGMLMLSLDLGTTWTEQLVVGRVKELGTMISQATADFSMHVVSESEELYAITSRGAVGRVATGVVSMNKLHRVRYPERKQVKSARS